MTFPIFDLHCDTAYALLGKDGARCGSLRQNDLHIDLERAGKLSGYAQCFACFTSESDLPDGTTPVQMFERQMATIFRELERNADKIRLAYHADQIQENQNKGIISAVLSIEGPAGFDYDPQLLEDLYKVGFRISTLGWNDPNPLTGSHLSGGGLTDLGREYVTEAQRQRMIIDASHISDEGFWDIISMTTAPVIASHSNSRSICNVSRNLTDDMFRAICETGGLAGINFYTEFVGWNADIDALCDHIFRFLELDPEGEHIALGGDLDGCDRLCADIVGIQDYPRLAQRLLERGLDKKLIENIYWNNAIGVIKRCCT